MEYNFRKIEADWQKYWAENQTFKAENNSTKPKYYVLDMFPYPSGAGLHVGHPLGYIASDIYARYKRHKGFNVLHPQGYDSFGLPAEQYAIQTGQHPAITTEENIKTYRKQLDQIGFSFDWSREVRTSDPNYYKWTQWIFLQLFKKGLAYKAKMPINWCPSCKIGLANEESVNNICDRCGGVTIKKEKEQWMIKITEYADRLIDDLDLVDYPERVKISRLSFGAQPRSITKFKIASGKYPSASVNAAILLLSLITPPIRPRASKFLSIIKMAHFSRLSPWSFSQSLSSHQ